MDAYLTVIKDFLVIASPIIVAYISYRSNKKTKRDIHLEIEKSLKEKNADTSQILAKINAELESQKQLISWNNSLPQKDKYVDKIDPIRYGNIAALPDLTYKISSYIEQYNLQLQELSNIHNMLLKIKLPLNEDELYPYEIPIIIDFLKLLHSIEEKMNTQNN